MSERRYAFDFTKQNNQKNFLSQLYSIMYFI